MEKTSVIAQDTVWVDAASLCACPPVQYRHISACYTNSCAYLPPEGDCQQEFSSFSPFACLCSDPLTHCQALADLSPASAGVGTALHFWCFSVWCSLPYAPLAVIWSLITLVRMGKKRVSRKCCRAAGQGAASQQFPTGREVSALTLCWWNPWLIPTRFSSWNISDKADILRTLWSMTGNSMNCRAQEREAQLKKYPLFLCTKGELIPWSKSQVLLQQFFHVLIGFNKESESMSMQICGTDIKKSFKITYGVGLR